VQSEISNIVALEMPQPVPPETEPEKVTVVGLTPTIIGTYLNSLVSIPEWLVDIIHIHGLASITVKAQSIQADASTLHLYRSLDNGKTFTQVGTKSCKYSLGRGHYGDICKQNPTVSYTDREVKAGDRVIYKVRFSGHGNTGPYSGGVSNFSNTETLDIEAPVAK